MMRGNNLVRLVLAGALAASLSVACSGSDGSNGANGKPGADGEPGVGTPGNPGDPGDPGSAGLSALVNVSAEAAGENCADGGQKIESGLDDNADGTLDAAEVDSTVYVCNGGGGAGTPNTLVSVTAEAAGENCAEGGQKIESGVDDSMNGVLDPDEVDNTSYVCNGGSVGIASNESCSTCHGAGKILDVAVNHPDELAPANVVVTGVTTLTGGELVVNFTVKSQSGSNVNGLTLSNMRFYLADLIPEGATDPNGKVWDTAHMERWAYERTGTHTVNGVVVAYPQGTFTGLGNGAYSYQFATIPGDADALASAPDYAATNTKRLVMRVSADGYGSSIGIQDFTLAGALLAPQRVLAPTDGCKKCHSDQMQNAAHAGGYLDTRACVVCHTPLGADYGEEMQTDEAWLTPLVHKIHAAIPMAAFPDRIDGKGYGAVTYPQDIRNCTTCHTGNEGMTDAWKSNPTAVGCTSCHETTTFVTGGTHSGGPQATNALCSGCHGAAAIEGYHAIPAPDAVNVPEFDVALSLTAPANGTHYVAGEAPMVTVTLKDHATGTAVDSEFYTTAAGDAGVTTDKALKVASVYIYGPRAKAVPVLATNTMTDPAFDPATLPTQGHAMFTGGTDPLVETDATGFKYQLLAIPADMPAGTYLVRVRIGDYSRVAAGDYHIESTAFTTIQIGSATEELKVSGDACMGCHNTGNFEPHNERHSVVFDTDECLSCHDSSGNHAINIGNRVHAIHSANSDGDLYNIEGGARDWEEVTYPAEPSNCMVCHNSGSKAYKTKQTALPCAGCHVESTNTALDHMRQNGGPF